MFCSLMDLSSSLQKAGLPELHPCINFLVVHLPPSHGVSWHTAEHMLVLSGTALEFSASPYLIAEPPVGEWCVPIYGSGNQCFGIVTHECSSLFLHAFSWEALFWLKKFRYDSCDSGSVSTATVASKEIPDVMFILPLVWGRVSLSPLLHNKIASPPNLYLDA